MAGEEVQASDSEHTLHQAWHAVNGNNGDEEEEEDDAGGEDDMSS